MEGRGGNTSVVCGGFKVENVVALIFFLGPHFYETSAGVRATCWKYDKREGW